ncbi:endothelin-converting enzyme homolog [Trichonephila clavata]|uniref:Endothelin-converting enzyme homolog n=1 Tax=Trichonephila clavata TaxID=2740835 RepID=A0A8X6H4Y6_TRICU|nr:endothelin-converting enzyme homolog [Trichonephila clavata]
MYFVFCRYFRQPSTGPTPGESKVPYLIMIVILILVTSASLVLLHIFVGYKNLTESTALLQKKTLRDNECNKKFCYSKGCLQMASRTLQLLNSEADPCTDFYEYSCGGYAKSQSIPYGHHSYPSGRETQREILLNIKKIMESPSERNETVTTRKLKQLYRSCTNSEQRDAHQKESLENWLSEVELYLGDDHSEFGMDLESPRTWKRLASRLEEYQIHTFVKPSFKSSTSVPIEKIEIECILPFFPPEVYLNSSSSNNAYMLSLYRDMIDNALKLLMRNLTKRKQFVEDIIEIEMDISRAIRASETFQYQMISSENIQLLKDLWKTIVGEAIQEVEIVSVCKHDIESIISAINNAQPKKATNYIIWKMLSQLIKYLGKDYQDLYLHYMSKLAREEYAFESMWEKCSEFIRREFGLAAFKALLDSGYIQAQQIQETKNAFLEVKRNFLYTFQSVDWAKGVLKRLFLNKVQTMKFYPGFPDSLITQQNILDTIYRDLEIEDNFFLDVMNFKKFKTRYFFTRLWYGNAENSPSKISLEDNPLGDRSYYDYISNTVHIDIGLLSPPGFIYFGSIPKYLKFGEYSLLSREMSHAFDASGTFYDGKGGKWEKIWWPTILEEKYDFYVQCLQNQTMLLQNSSEDESVQILNTIIADIGSFIVLYSGLSAHLDTWKNEKELPGLNLTKEQLYYVRVAQKYCELHEPSMRLEDEFILSPRIRVNIAVSNSKEFGDVFSCSRNSPLNPEIKCNLQ